MSLSKAKLYYLQVNWQKRLNHELPFLERLCRQHDVETLLDLGCGPGVHAIALAKDLGISVIGVDVDEDMLAVARDNVEKAGLQDQIQLIHGDIFQVSSDVRVDAMICLGNALGIILTDTEAMTFFKKVHETINPGGFFFAQQLNPENPRNGYMASRSLKVDGKEVLLLKRFEPRPTGILADFVFLSRDVTENGKGSDNWTVEWDSNLLKMKTRTELEEILRDVGFQQVESYSDHDGSAFDPETSDSLLVLALKDE